MPTTTSVVQTERPEDAAIARIDFACVLDKQLLVYGWVLNFSTSVQTASIHIEDAVIDLGSQAIRVLRFDVTRHFSTRARNDEHGFYALIDLPENAGTPGQLRLSINLRSGETTETHWPVSIGDAAAAALQTYTTTLKTLLRDLPRADAHRLIDFTAPVLPLQMESEPPGALPPPVRFEIDMCCLLENRILVVVGWLFDPVNELTRVQARFGASVFELLDESVRASRPNVAASLPLYASRNTKALPGFIFVRAMAPPAGEEREVRFAVAAGGQTMCLSRTVCRNPTEARRDLLSLLNSLDAEAALVLIERVASVLDDSPAERSLHALLEFNRSHAIERLPVSIQHSRPRYSLYIDGAIPVAGEGLYLTGWFDAEPAASIRITCHSGPRSFVVSDAWIRHLRRDVMSHLESTGVQSNAQELGFSCYVPLRSGDEPAYLSAAPASGEARLMRLNVAEKAESAIDTVRAVLTSFASDHRDLRVLLDGHAGPAATAAWATRQRPSREAAVRTYGPRPAHPAVSIIVPLYGRYDLVEYQMALFADDPEFQTVELIYVVDDPSIFDEFRNACPDIYGIYQVPFITIFAGANLGFAGANNLGAGSARGQYLLLMNSDVMPRRPGWIGDLLRVHGTLEKPGLLGAKLLYEDGSIQHAGMAFRRYAAWSGLWINDHPMKGQSPIGLNGVREADAVTAACALIEAALYRELGGFSEDYIVGDFEDSDLCLRASSVGRRNYVALDVELYHLERQSQDFLRDAVWRRNLTLYNCWLHNRRWADFIERTKHGDRALPAGCA